MILKSTLRVIITINNLHKFADLFLKKDSIAIYNDITNFLRVGDITQIKKDGSIEIVEVKASKQRGSRITRQKQRITFIDIDAADIGLFCLKCNKISVFTFVVNYQRVCYIL